MKAEEARRISEERRNGKAEYSHLLEYVRRRITQAATEGKVEIVDPLEGLRTPMTIGQKQSVWDALALDGYEVLEKENDAFGGMSVYVSW